MVYLKKKKNKEKQNWQTTTVSPLELPVFPFLYWFPLMPKDIFPPKKVNTAIVTRVSPWPLIHEKYPLFFIYCYRVISRSLKNWDKNQNRYFWQVLKLPTCYLKFTKHEIPRPFLYCFAKLMSTRTYPEETADISWRHYWFLREMASEERAQKFHTDNVSLSRSG